jgi:hypothetical protein
MGETSNEVRAAAEGDTSQLREEIERTREGLSETIEEISERLAPRNIVADARDSLKQAAAEKVRVVADTASQVAGKATDRARELTDRARGATSDMVGQVRKDPWPTALVGVGLGWWLVQTLANRSSSRADRAAELEDKVTMGADNAAYAFDPVQSRSSWLRSTRVPAIVSGLALAWCATRMMGDRRRVDRSYDPYGDMDPSSDTSAASPGEQSGRDWARTVRLARERVGEVAEQTATTAGRVGRQTGERMTAATFHAQDWISKTVRETPKSAGLVALAAGVGLGLALPKRARQYDRDGA